MLTEVLNKSKIWFTSKFKKTTVNQETKKTVVCFLEVEAENLVLDALKLLQGNEARLRAYKKFIYKVNDDNQKKCTVKLVSFTNNSVDPRLKELLGFQSKVEFHLDSKLWIPRKLEIILGPEPLKGDPPNPPKFFECDITRKYNDEKEEFEPYYTCEIKKLK